MNLYVANDNLIKITGLTRASNEAYVNDATVTVQLSNLDGSAIGSPITASYQAGSNGVYMATVPYTAAITVGVDYILAINAQVSGGTVANWKVRVKALARLVD